MTVEKELELELNDMSY